MSDIHNIEHRRLPSGGRAPFGADAPNQSRSTRADHGGQYAAANRLAWLEGTESALVLSSGMAATSCALLSLLRPGDGLLASSLLHGETRLFLEHELSAFGVETTFVDPTEPRAWRRAVRSNSRVLFLESPVDRTTRVIDMRPARIIAREIGMMLVVDSTIASPINMRPAEQGADMVIHSAAGFLTGDPDVLAGVVCGSTAVIDEVRAKMALWGQMPSPAAVWCLERGLKTLDVRVQRQNSNAMRIAQWAESQAAIRQVHYTGLVSHPDHELAVAQLDGFGSLLGLELAGGADAASRVVPELSLFVNATEFGGVDSTVSAPGAASHRQVSPEGRAALHFADGFLRLSIGLEHADDLIADLERALGLIDSNARRAPGGMRANHGTT